VSMLPAATKILILHNVIKLTSEATLPKAAN
jgi:hypothetical protein